MPSQKFTLRLPPPLVAAVQAYLDATGILFADLARAALSAYLSDTKPTGAGTQADTKPTPADRPADRVADRLAILEMRLEALTTRVEGLQHAPTRRRQRADRGGQKLADREPTRADREPTGADGEGQGYNATRYILGKLCPRGHEWQQTGQTLRRLHNRDCPQCSADQKRAARRARRSEGS